VVDDPLGGVKRLAFTPDCQTLVSTHANLVIFWDAESGAQRGALRLAGCPWGGLAFSPDGETLAVSDFGRVRLLPWRQLI
jgi:WD40 repeat protein